MTVWQISAGANQRDYHRYFLDHGLAFVGWDKQEKLLNLQPGDILALKRGLKEIIAIGKVVIVDGKHLGSGDKVWLNDFDGWNLNCYVHVAWRRVKKPLNPKGLTMGTVKRVNNAELRDQILTAYETGITVESLRQEPEETKEVSDEEIVSSLVNEGLSPLQAEDLVAAFGRIRRLAHFYRSHHWGDVGEHEARTFLVVPLMLALGWSEQRMKIELGVRGEGRIDLACFEYPYHMVEKRKCRLLIETKGFTQGLTFAPDQALRYAEHFPERPYLVVTNGYCYRLYQPTESGYLQHPTAYMNLLDPRDRFPIDPENTAGCLEVLKALLP